MRLAVCGVHGSCDSVPGHVVHGEKEEWIQFQVISFVSMVQT